MNEKGMSYKKTVLKSGFTYPTNLSQTKIVRYVIGENLDSKTWFWEILSNILGLEYSEKFYIHRDDGPAIISGGVPYYQLNGQRINMILKGDRIYSSAEVDAAKALEYKRFLSLMYHMKMRIEHEG
jgi:hypothetical protein